MKKMISIKNMTICSVLTASMLTGCAAMSNSSLLAHTGDEMVQKVSIQEEDTPLSEAGNDTENKKNTSVMVNTEATADFDRALMEFVESAGFAEENYMVSPTSFRAALALAVAGADTKTKDELIHAMGFIDMDEVNAWYASVSQIIDDFDADIAADVKEFKQNQEWFPRMRKSLKDHSLC